MRNSEIVSLRLFNQQIAETKFRQPQEIVQWMGAMQAQEYAMAKWAIGLRVPGMYDADVEDALNNGSILRTHLLRPTWHFVTPPDIRWMLALTGPRVIALSASMYRRLELDMPLFKRSHHALTKALQGGNQLTRTSLQAALRKAKIEADGLRLACLLMRAELDGIICSGARTGKQFTYALLEERVPQARNLSRGEALAELALRYFTSRGPATHHDFVWWSGLTMKDAKAGTATLPQEFVHETVNGEVYFFRPVPLTLTRGHQATFLMPDYDEYGIAYKNRSAIFIHPPEHGGGRRNTPEPAGHGMPPDGTYNHMIVIDGMIAGTWKRTIKKDALEIKTTCFTPLSKAKKLALDRGLKKYISFTAKAF